MRFPTCMNEAGQLGTTSALPLYLNALPYLYEWSRKAKGKSLIKGLALTFAAATAHHVTLIFGAVLFALPILVLAIYDRNADGEERATGAILSRAFVFAIGVAVINRED